MNNQKVLVVDDERGFLQIVNIILQRAGYDPILASSAEEAMTLIDKHNPIALILDDDMPDTPGSELCYHLKTDPTTKHIAVVMFSANERIEDPTYITKIKADRSVRKPCMPADILTALEESLPKPANV